MRKILLSLAVLVSVHAMAQQTITLGDLTYTVTSANTVEVTSLANTNATTVNIPATISNNGTTYNVKAIGEQAFYWEKVSSVTIPASVDSIKKQAFNRCELTSVTFNNGLKYIGYAAFNGTKLTEVSLPASTETIDENAFFTCYNLQKVTLNEGLKLINPSAFYSCTALASINFPSTLHTIGKQAFGNCKSLTNIQLNEGLQTIEDGAFYNCANLANATLPSTLVTLGAEAFLKCKALTSFHIPAKLEEIGSSFIGETSVNNLSVDTNNQTFELKNSVLYSKNPSVVYAIPMTGYTTLNIEDGCIGINGGACWGSELTSVTFPEDFLAIDDYAFIYTKITNINLPNTITYIGEQAFAATALQSVVLPENLVYLLDGTFASCKQLTSVVIPSSVAVLDNHIFNNCSKLTSITFLGSSAPVMVDYYESYNNPFYGISSTTKVYIPKGSSVSYFEEGYNELVNIQEQATGNLQVASTTPANEDTVSGWTSMSFEITFKEPVQITNESPEVGIRMDNLLAPNCFTPDDSWKALLSADKTKLIIFASDYDGYTQAYKYDETKEYYITIPANIVKNALGDVNERIVIHLLGKTASAIESVSTNNKVEVARYNLNGQQVFSTQKGIQIVKYADGSTAKQLVR